MNLAAWRKSTYSGTTSNSECVEVAPGADAVGVRDSKLPGDQPIIVVSRTTWTAFIQHVSR